MYIQLALLQMRIQTGLSVKRPLVPQETTETRKPYIFEGVQCTFVFFVFGTLLAPSETYISCDSYMTCP